MDRKLQFLQWVPENTPSPRQEKWAFSAGIIDFPPRKGREKERDRHTERERAKPPCADGESFAPPCAGAEFFPLFFVLVDTFLQL